MNIEILADAQAVADRAAAFIAEEARAAVAARGRFTIALSGGSTPWAMLGALAGKDMPWQSVHVFQVDERIAPAGNPERNLTRLAEILLSIPSFPQRQLYALPVNATDLADGAAAYAQTIESLAGSPPEIDLVHLGLGADGHTASLVPDDPVLAMGDSLVALTGVYIGRHRMTLTYPVLNGARKVLWLVTGAGKTQMLQRLLAGDPTIPAGRVRPDNALVLADRAAAGKAAASP